MLSRIVTRPEWETRVPASFCPGNERYWTNAEVPRGEWTFLVTTEAKSSEQTGTRILLVATCESLLELIADLGVESITSVHHFFLASDAKRVELKFRRLRSVEVAKDVGQNWHTVFLVRAEDGMLYGDESDMNASDRMTDNLLVASFGMPALSA